jgi:hypothetical protein
MAVKCFLLLLIIACYYFQFFYIKDNGTQYCTFIAFCLESEEKNRKEFEIRAQNYFRIRKDYDNVISIECFMWNIYVRIKLCTLIFFLFPLPLLFLRNCCRYPFSIKRNVEELWVNFELNIYVVQTFFLEVVFCTDLFLLEIIPCAYLND